MKPTEGDYVRMSTAGSWVQALWIDASQAHHQNTSLLGPVLRNCFIGAGKAITCLRG